MSRIFNPSNRGSGVFVTQDQLDDELAIYTRNSTYLAGQGIQDIAIDSAYVEGDDAIFGDLTVNGTTTHINSSIVDMVDETIELNSARAAIASGGLTVLLTGEDQASLSYEVSFGKWFAGANGGSEPIARIDNAPTDQALLKYDTNTARIISASAVDVKTIYESNVDTNAYTDADATSVGLIDGISTVANAALSRAGGTMTGDIVMGANNITLTTGLVDGVDVSARDAVLTTTTTTANAALSRAGGTMTGDIVMGANNITLTTGLVDGVDVSARDAVLTTTTTTANAALSRAGGTMTGDIVMGANNITLTTGLVDGVDVSARDAVLTTTTTTANAALSRAGGTMTGDIVMGANNITLTTGLVDGVDVSARDAVLTTTTTTANAALSRAGGTMTGDIVMGANNITLTTGLVDGVDVSARDAVLTSTTTTANAALSRAGGTMTGNITMGANTITGTGSFHAGDNSGVNLATITFSQQPNTGFYRAANSRIDVACNGVNSGFWASTGISTTGLTVSTSVMLPAGTAAAPSLAVVQGNMGLYRPSANVLGFATQGSVVMTLDGGSAVFYSPSVRPAPDNTSACGGLSNRWSAVYAGNGVIQTSDSRMKNTITALPSALGLSFIDSLNPVSFKWNDTINEGIAPIVHTRTHLGLIAQEVKTAIEAAGHTLQTTDIIDNDYLLDNTQTDRYAIRMHALIAPLIKAVQELSARVVALESTP